MRRPPDKDGQASLSERDVDTSNATLNTLFGGARQKSWMTGAPTRPTPRANMSRGSVPQVMSTQRNNITVLPSPASSNDSSPIIPNDSVSGRMHGNQRGESSSRSALSAVALNDRATFPQPNPGGADHRIMGESSRVISNDSTSGRMQVNQQSESNSSSALNATALNDRAAFQQPDSGGADRTMREFSSPREEIQIESPLHLPLDQTTPTSMGVDLPSLTASNHPSLTPLVLLSPELQSNTIPAQNVQPRPLQRTSSGGTHIQGNSYIPPTSGLGLVESQPQLGRPEQQFNSSRSPRPSPLEINPSASRVPQRAAYPREPGNPNQFPPSNQITTSSGTGPQGSTLPLPRRPTDPSQFPTHSQTGHQGTALPPSRRPTDLTKLPAPIKIAGPSTAGPQGTASPSPGLPTGYQPSPRQRVQVASMPSLRPRIALIEAHLNSVGGEGSLNMSLERPRFQLLMEACSNEDPFYVALHQLFLVWDTNREEILRIQGFPDVSILRTAFQTITTLIKGNDALAPNHKNWFARFPSPLNDLLRTSEPYRRTVADVGVFLDKLARLWLPLTQECARRGYPVLVDELVNKLGLLSPILQGVVFTATRRNIGIRDEPTSNRMDELFKKDQYEHQNLAARYNTSRPPTAKELSARNEALANEYIKLHNQLIQHRQAATSMAGSNPGSRGATPTVPNNMYVQNGASQPPNVVSRSEQGVPQQQSWPQNVPSPDPSGNWQFAGPQVRTPSSTNPPIVPGRPASVGPHQLHANTPSPTLLQGLSMQSPIQPNFQFAPILRSNNGPLQPNQFSASPNPSATYYSSPLQNGQPFQQGQYVPQPQQHTSITQTPQQQQQIGAQHQQQIQHNIAAHQNNQNSMQQIQWQQHRQHQILQQQRQAQQQAIPQQFQGSRAAHLRRDPSIPIDPQRVHSRTSSISSNGRRTPSVIPQLPYAHPARNASLPPERDEEGLIAYAQAPPSQRQLIPPLGFTIDRPPGGHNGEINALHQALLRSPRLTAADFASSEKTQNDPAFRYYQAIRSLALGPVRLSSSPISKFEFKVPQLDHSHIPKDSFFTSSGQTPIREFRRGTLQYRIRCVKMDKSAVECSFPDWVVADTVWPEHACLEMNNKQLELRRKSHHSKDMPIDVTQLARNQGSTSPNKITFSVTRSRKDLKDYGFFLGVDVVEILGHQQILDICQENRLPATDTLNKIKKSLAPPPSDDDDDFAMVVSDISIDLTDPWMSKIFNIPVRGSNCLHRECFDLETFLLTRNSKIKRPQQPCMVDTWKCPLCSRDARPRALRIDEFLVGVRASLAEQGKLDVRAIWVSADGSWRPKIEKRKATGDPDESDYSSDGDGASRRKAQKQVKASQAEVIALDDD